MLLYWSSSYSSSLPEFDQMNSLQANLTFIEDQIKSRKEKVILKIGASSVFFNVLYCLLVHKGDF